jgi:hypothetical protein
MGARPAAAVDRPHDFSALMEIAARPDLVFVRGEGSWLWDDRGRRYLDFVQGWAVNSLGPRTAISGASTGSHSGAWPPVPRGPPAGRATRP